MAKINQPPRREPSFPWGEPQRVRERLVDPAQVAPAKNKRRKGDPKDPPLASIALIDFIGPAHSADDLRLPAPPRAPTTGADLVASSDRPQLKSAVSRVNPESTRALEGALRRLNPSAERADELRAQLDSEGQMIELLRQLHGDVDDIHRRMREEQKESGY
jgi:hypothetical protein